MIDSEIYVSATEKRKRLRSLLERGEPIWVPGVYDGLSAKMAEQAGAEVVIVSGFAVSAALMGEADAELYTMSEMRTTIQHIANAVNIPVMADGDNGFGNAINVMRTVQEYEKAGAVSITIEDQVAPKKCPLIVERAETVSMEEGVGKIRAAAEGRRDRETVIVARIDTLDYAEAIERACAYAEAGADVVKPICSKSCTPEQLVEMRRRCGRPLAVSRSGSLKDVDAAGMAAFAGVVTFPLSPILSVTRSLQKVYGSLMADLHEDNLNVEPVGTDEFKSLIGFDTIQRFEERYLPAK